MSGPAAKSMARVSCPRTTTCSRSRTSAPTAAIASNSALVTPGRSSPEMDTRSVSSSSGESGESGSDTAKGYRRLRYAPAHGP